MDGLQSIEFKQLTDRNFSMIVTMSSGFTKEAEFSVPSVLDCGVFKASRSYQKGDGVTYGGSFWIAQQDMDASSSVLPGSTDQWRLSVKKGRDGKDGERGKAGPAGAAGRNGRDLTQMGPDGRKW